MNLTWQIVKKDARRLRWPLALWLALVAGDVGLGFWLAHDWAAAWHLFPAIMLFHVILIWLQVPVCILLTFQLVHEDRPSDPRAFWPTRPISRRRLLGAKLFGLVVLLWLPTLVLALPWWISSGLGTSDMADVVLVTLLRQATITLPVLALASVTPDLRRFLLWGALAAISAPLVFSVLATGRILDGNAYAPALQTGAAIPVGRDEQSTRFMLALGEMLLIGFGATICQYLTGRVRYAVALLAVAGAVGWLGSRIWPWDLPTVFSAPSYSFESAKGTDSTWISNDGRLVHRAPAAQIEGSELAFAGTLTRVSHGRFDGMDATVRPWQMPLLFKGVPSDQLLVVEWSEIKLAPGPNRASGASAFGSSSINLSDNRVSPPLQTIMDAPSIPVTATRTVAARLDFPNGIPSQPSAYAKLQLSVWKYEQELEAPLRAGGHDAHEPNRLTVVHWNAFDGSFDYQLTALLASRSAAQGENLLDGLLGRTPNAAESRFILINRSRTPIEGMPGTFSNYRSMRISGVNVILRAISFTPDTPPVPGRYQYKDPPISEGPWLRGTPNAQWLEGASVLALKQNYLGWIEREATAENLEVRDDTETPPDDSPTP
jgi:hypothetical protein